jgi:hypothetical protein
LNGSGDIDFISILQELLLFTAVNKDVSSVADIPLLYSLVVQVKKSVRPILERGFCHALQS